ncbi:MAG: prepilin-type N-terminal cleavage/methylation domain-containing protein [Lachnospiraceae bacterium]|nr:prepilin-type N-terminal cleavage/methylation domain-containing protein [Lachnospiraceae bacterium]
MKKNQGLSLIELVVVVAIMSLLVGLVAISVTVLSRQKVGNAASDVKSLLQTAQTIAMSKDDCHVEIQVINGSVVFTTYSSASSIIDKVTLDKKITVNISYNGGANMNSCGAVGLYYERESGSFTNSYVNGSTGNPKTGTSVDAIRWIEFTNGSKSVRLTLTKLTGKVSY